MSEETGSHTLRNGRPILVPVDFSDCSRYALVYAATLVKETGNTLLVLHVVHDAPDAPGSYHRVDENHPSRPMIDIATDMLDGLLAELRREYPGLAALETARTLLVHGLPGKRIIEIARHEHPAMILMGTHGRSGFAHFLQGSVAEYVSKHAGVPVTTVREDDTVPGKLNLDEAAGAQAQGG
jgi:nucleotide-binding universal stress UspA family protein